VSSIRTGTIYTLIEILRERNALIHYLYRTNQATGQLDPATGARVLNLLFDLHESIDITLVLISHDSRLADWFDRIIRLKEGHISYKPDGTTEVTNHVDQK
jgi:predicted ABC-type transport system involved in lysophospholipase L1 biosynthesis ATPase subunit